ncbi:hypothetical protein [Microbacterium sp. LBN7]|uniref:hypothetical protein n=1 Tax=Microbacterium sp. LBN7 TaxID=3129773 RepID=UPI0032432897
MTIHDSHAVDPASVLFPRTVEVDLSWLFADLQESLRDPDPSPATRADGGGDAVTDAARSRLSTSHHSAMRRAIDFVIRRVDRTATRSA